MRWGSSVRLSERTRFGDKHRNQIGLFPQQLFHLIALFLRARPSRKPGDLFPEFGWYRGCSTSGNLLVTTLQELEQDLKIIIHKREW
ncbi:MAG TPA: hypothetical protein VF345_06535 [Chthoniobacterales bacterium]